ncbi:hypothetical protein [Desulfuromonas acetoxidans]|uniref:hypothetical protein n=1 Tax=Desulfuromonas acetoxidans TaxID=891 RepID=UPI0029306976|nr:hypothetical protein [Desulfuromonas acetoxidans]
MGAKQLAEGWALPTCFVGATEKLESGVTLLSVFYANADELQDLPSQQTVENRLWSSWTSDHHL